ncbi:MAG: BACON domain-containing protein [Prevotella sp.]|nr:BACON domain-containing protein [Prevotella sp.]
MKTRNIIAILAALPLVAGFTGCKSDEETEAKPAKEILIVEGGSIEFRGNETDKSVAINADCGWTVEYEQGTFDGKLTVQPLKGSGQGTLVITADENTSTSERTASITLTSDGGLKQKIAIRQTSGDPAMNVSKGTFNFDAVPTESQLLTITSNTSWSIQMPSGVNWLHLDKTSGGNGAEAIDLSVDEIQSDADRSATLTIKYGSNSTEVVVNQKGKTNIELSVSPNELPYFQAEGGSQMFQVTSNASWRAYVPSSAQSWLRVEPTEGVGNGEVRVTVTENPNPERERLSLVIIIAGSQSPKQGDVLVQQYRGNEENTQREPDEGDNPDPTLSRKR